MSDTPRTAAFDRSDLLTLPFHEAPCQCVKRHCPRPATIEKHHIFPKGHQIEVWGKVRHPETVALCGVAHNNVHLLLDLMLAGQSIPPHANAYLEGLARQGYAAYTAAVEGGS